MFFRHTGGMRILLVEDDASLGDTIQTWLRLDQHAVDWVRRGDSAHTALLTHHYDCVPLDRGVPVMTAKDLLAKGKDDQYLTLKGKITSHKGDEDYEFTDQSGKITVEISPKRFPAGQTIDHNTLVELTGEFDKEIFGASTLDVKQIKIVAK